MLGAFLRESILYRRYKEVRGLYAAYLYGNPSEQMTVIGITGTDGKTTTCTLVYHILLSLGKKVIMIGTNGVMINGVEIGGVSKMTSYDPMDLQKYLALGVQEGCTYAVLEVSSHALSQRRFKKVTFSVAALTNISNEHLDYHQTFENYAIAKQKLFRQLQDSGKEGIAVLPMDDKFGRQRAERMRFGRTITYGNNPNSFLKIMNMRLHPTSTELSFEAGGVPYEVTVPLLGKFNMLNIAGAVSIAIGLGFEVPQVLETLKTYKQAKGRQEHYEVDGIHRYIDFAHTPNGLQSVLDFLYGIKKEGRVICVFGAPGQRDAYKRPEMGKVVQSLADIVIVTDDDPAGENRWQILRQIDDGITLQEGDRYYLIPNRRHAIAFAVQLAKPGDVVLLAGKGHETVLVTNFGKEPWSDVEVLREELRKVHPESV